MSENRPTIHQHELTEAGAALGYEDITLQIGSGRRSQNEGRALGRVGFSELSGGITAQVSELQFEDAVRQDGIIPRSFYIALQLSGPTMECWLNGEQKITSKPASVLSMAVSDKASFGGTAPPGTRVRSLVARLDPDQLRDPDLAASVDAILGTTEVKFVKVNAAILERAERVVRSSLDDVIERLHAESLILELAALALAHWRAEPGHDQDFIHSTARKIIKVRDLILEDTTSPFTLESLAQHGSVSVSTLTSRFPEVVGMPVFDFVRNVRLDFALDLMENQGWSVSAAAHKVGYAHASNFSAAF